MGSTTVSTIAPPHKHLSPCTTSSTLVSATSCFIDALYEPRRRLLAHLIALLKILECPVSNTSPVNVSIVLRVPDKTHEDAAAGTALDGIGFPSMEDDHA
jgi:hypothetical protein